MKNCFVLCPMTTMLSLLLIVDRQQPRCISFALCMFYGCSQIEHHAEQLLGFSVLGLDS